MNIGITYSKDITAIRAKIPEINLFLADGKNAQASKALRQYVQAALKTGEISKCEGSRLTLLSYALLNNNF